MSDIIEKETYNWILIKKSGEYMSWSKSLTEPPCGEPDILEWIKWDKELPEDIDTADYWVERLEDAFEDMLVDVGLIWIIKQ